MIRALSIILLIFAASCAQAQESAAMRLAAVIQWPKAKQEYPTYAEGYAEALATNRPLLIYVGIVPRATATGAVVCMTERMDGYPAQSVVVAVPYKGEVYWRATLGRSATDLDFKTAIEREVRRPAEPFRVIQQPRVVTNCRT